MIPFSDYNQVLQDVARFSTGQTAQDAVEKVSLYPWLKGLCERLLKRQESAWRASYNFWLRNVLMYCSHANMTPSGKFGFRAQQDQKLYPWNTMRPDLEQTLASYMGSQPVNKFVPVAIEERRSRHIARELESLDEYFWFRLFKKEDRMNSLLEGMLFGHRWFEVWYDPDSNEGCAYEQELHEIEMGGGIRATCYHCGGVETGNDPESIAQSPCPDCGGTARRLEEMPVEQMTLPGEMVPKRTGDIRQRFWSALQVRFDRVTGAKESPYLYVEEDLPREVYEERYGKADNAMLGVGFAKDEMMHPMRVLRRFETERMAGNTSSDEWTEVLAQHFFLSPSLLHFVAADKDEVFELPNAEPVKVPANVRLSQVFPRGLKLTTSPGADKFADMQLHCHHNRFVCGKQQIAPGQKIGLENRDGARLNYHSNVLRSGVFRYLQKTLQPAIAAPQSLFPEREFWNTADGVIHYNHNLLNGANVANLLHPIVPPPINGQVFAAIQQMDNASRAAWQAFTSESDGFQTANPTATAVKASENRRDTSHAMVLMMEADTMLEVAELRLGLARQNYEDLRVIQTRDARTNEWRGRDLKKADIDADFLAYVLPGSAMPDYISQKVEKVLQAVQMVTGLMQIGIPAQQSIPEVSQLVGVDLSFTQQFASDEQEERLYEQWQQMAGQGAGVEQLLLFRPVLPQAQNIPQKLEFWLALLNSNEGWQMQPVLMQAIQERVAQYKIAAAMQAAELQMLTGPPQEQTGETESNGTSRNDQQRKRQQP